MFGAPRHVFNLIDYSEELQSYLNARNIRSFEYSQFNNIKLIGDGGFAIVYSALFQEKKYALKRLKDSSLDEKRFKPLRRELELLYITDHSNIVKFYGISEAPGGYFTLVFQLATGGNLREYLQNKRIDGLYKISWVELIGIAKDITLGLMHLHDNDIIHRDLHAKNILMNNGRALITDFGISKQIKDTTTSSSNTGGVAAYIEPQYYLSNKKPDKKSDIYSLGVLFWELTSGVRPFYDLPDPQIILLIGINKREKSVVNTPSNYVNLYRKCWSSDSNRRPTLNYILMEIDRSLAETTIDITNKVDQQLLEYPDEDDNLNIYDDCCTECENATETLIPNYMSLSSFSIAKSMPQRQDDLESISIEYLEQSSNRHRIIRPIELINGNLIIESPVSSLLSNISCESSNEFTHMSYTCKPDAFKQENFTLRQTKYELTRMTELLILLTIDDEDEILLSSTLYRIMENTAYLCSLRESPEWGQDGWKKIIICIISDRNNINKRTLSYLKALGIYQDGFEKSKVNNKTVSAHIYEYTTPISIKYSRDSVDKKVIIPAQILFCLQEKSKEKLIPINGFLMLFVQLLIQEFAFSLKLALNQILTYLIKFLQDKQSIYNLWKTFKNDQVAGSCGKLYITNDKRWIYLLNPVVGAQIFEREISNILIKPMESMLNNVICFELISKRNFSWLLHYECSSQAELVLPEKLSEIIQQHLCNLNGYFHTSFYATSHFYYIWRSEHSISRKISLQIEIIYQTIFFLFSWLALITNNFQKLSSSHENFKYEVYSEIVILIFYFIVLFLRSICVLYFNACLIMSNPWHLLVCFISIIQYILLVPFCIGLNIYTFCNHNTSSNQEVNSSIEIIPDIKSSSNTFGKDIVEVSFPCELNSNKAYNEAWNEIMKSSKNEAKYKTQAYSSKAFSPWSIILWAVCNALSAILFSLLGMAFSYQTT
ncbi:glycosyltransferase family 2 protein [Gigaspora margarita]|uniref:Chitin synthase n=1 Tax=Gigaspora margarita TaxID=4874 RepID=A0A8H4ACN0_GIGMA|nr:glycosyltransferase family 2 protein [Gigaspora margarita]